MFLVLFIFISVASGFLFMLEYRHDVLEIDNAGKSMAEILEI